MAHGFSLFYFVLVLSRQLAFQGFFSSSHHAHSKDAGPNIAPWMPTSMGQLGKRARRREGPSTKDLIPSSLRPRSVLSPLLLEGES